MICVSVRKKKAREVLQAIEGLALAEIRLDGMTASLDELRRIFSKPVKLIATMRPDDVDDDARALWLTTAIKAGAAYVDLELESDPSFRALVIDVAKASGCAVIISHHDFTGTPSREDLLKKIDACFAAGADIAKIACQIQVPKENARLLSLFEDARPIVVVGMGEMGRVTRIVAPFLGSPFTFASLASGEETASGQIDHRTLARIMQEIDDVAR